MREPAILTFVTLDGVMQAPVLPEENLSGDFKHGGWATSYWDKVMEQVEEVTMAESPTTFSSDGELMRSLRGISLKPAIITAKPENTLRQTC